MNHPTVIVTGASRGLGKTIAAEAAKMGANVVLAARSVDALQAAAAEINAAGGAALAVPGDVGEEADCQAIIQGAVSRFQHIDALVNNAGVIEPIHRIEEASLMEWQQNWVTNFLGPVMLSKLALPYLRERGGRVVNISSGAAMRAIAGWGAYSTAKAAIDHLTRILAAEEPLVTALSVRPGIIDTEMQAAIRKKGKETMDESDYNRLYGLYEQGKMATAEGPGRAIARLALSAPHAWSGEVLQWDDARVQSLVVST